MEVILLRDVEKVGLRGDIVNVAPGYARNFLLPRRLAEAATPGRVAEMRKLEERRARQQARSVDDARAVAARLEQAELRFDVKAGPTGSLFGSVTATDVADEVWRVLKVRVDRRKIGLPDPIKRIGRYAVPIEVFPDVTAEVRTLVVPEGGELPPEEELQAMVAAETAEAEGAADAALAATAAQDADLEQGAEEVTPEASPGMPPEGGAGSTDSTEGSAAAADVPDDDFDRAVDVAIDAGDLEPREEPV